MSGHTRAPRALPLAPRAQAWVTAFKQTGVKVKKRMKKRILLYPKVIEFTVTSEGGSCALAVPHQCPPMGGRFAF